MPRRRYLPHVVLRDGGQEAVRRVLERQQVQMPIAYL